MARKRALEVIQTELTDRQRLFIEQLLTGKNITDAADAVGISRRAATYWLHDYNHLVRLEYDRLRIMAKDAFRARIANLHNLALAALESALAEDAPPAIRFAAARFLYEAHLKDMGGMAGAHEPEDLVGEEVSQAKARDYFERYDAHHMNSIPD